MADESTTTTTTTETSAEAIKAAQFERDSIKAENAKLKRQLDEIKNQLPSEDDKKRIQDLEAFKAKFEEDEKKKAGKWDELKESLTKQHAREMDALKKQIADLESERDAVTQQYNGETVARAFAEASDWFGPNGKTVLLPEIAQTYFGRNVAVEVDDAGQRTVVVKDASGAPLLDPKTAKPMAFKDAIKTLIETHPQSDHLLRNSGKVGSGSAGGANGGVSQVDLRNLTPDRLRDPKVVEALKAQRPKNAVQMGRAWS